MKIIALKNALLSGFLIFFMSFTNGQKGIEIKVLTSSEEELRLKVTIPEIKLIEEVYSNNEKYHTIVSPVDAKLIPGQPSISAFTTKILIPNGRECKIEVYKGEAKRYEGIKLGPLQEETPDVEKPEPIAFKIDQKVYSTNANFPGLFAEVRSLDNHRGQQTGVLYFYPIQYNPVSQVLEAFDNLEISIKFVGRRTPISTRTFLHEDAEYLKSTSINAKAILKQEFRKTTSMIIVTHEDFIDAAYLLAGWRNQLGTFTKVVSVPEIGTSCHQIREYLRNEYEKSTPAPSYLLLLGDSEFIPTWYLMNFPDKEYKNATDLYYADLNSDLLNPDFTPELAYGRLPADTKEQALNMVNKIINHERKPQNQNFFKSVASIAYFQDNHTDGYDERRNIKTSEDMYNYLNYNGYEMDKLYITNSVNPQYYSNSSGYIFENDYLDHPLPPNLLMANGFPWNPSPTDIVNSVESGKVMVNFRTHGSRVSNTGGFSTYYVNTLDNSSKEPLVCDWSCGNGWFDNETDDPIFHNTNGDCITEYWLKHENGGAVAEISSTRITWNTRTSRINWGLMNAFWPGFLSFNYDYSFPTSISPIYKLGRALNYAKSYFRTKFTFNDVTRSNHETIQLFGDPAMELIPVNNNECPYNVDLSTSSYLIKNGYSIFYTASNQIKTGAFLVTSGGRCVMAAKNIVLQKGFKVTSNSYFNAIADPCNSLALGTSYSTSPNDAEGINPIKEQKNYGVKISPNPNNGSFFIDLGTQEKIGSIQIYNSIGALVYEKHDVNTQTRVDLSNQPKGMYFVKTKIEENTSVEKIILR